MPYLTFTGCDDSPAYNILWNIPKKYSIDIQSISTTPLTQTEEVWNLVQEFYEQKGLPIPPEERNACLQAIQEERNPRPVQEPERPKTLEEALGPKPAWGDPLFWDYWRKAKALGFTKKTK